MSKRTIADFCRAAFLARDKASADKIIKDAEEEIPQQLQNGNGNGEDHSEPDGDEGDTKHASNIHIHVEHGAKDSVEGRIAKLEDGMAKLTTSFDSFAQALKDGDPPWLKKDGDDDKTEDTADEGIEAPDGEKGELTAEKLTEAEPELMNADPSLKTGKNQMGDAAYQERLGKGVARLVKDIKARAEILSPGIKFSATVDAKPSAKTADALCGMRRLALTKAADTEAGKQALGRFTPDTIKAMSCDMVRTVFLDASDRMKAHNNQSGAYVGDDTFVDTQRQVERLKGINKANTDFWSKQLGRPNIVN